MKVLVVASHSAGHIWPAIAFCQGLKEKNKCVDINFISTDGELERRLIDNNINSALLFKKEKINIFTCYKLLTLTLRAKSMINELSPDLIAGFGGYLSVPFIISAYYQKIPNFIHEQNFDMGIANKFLSRITDQVIFSFPNSPICDRLKNKSLFLGLPLRTEIRRLDKKESLEYFGLDSNRFTLFVMGGSQGSVNINTQIMKILSKEELNDIQVIHSTGFFDYKRVEEEYKNIKTKHKVLPFIDRMDYAFSACDLTICRAGAGTIAEIIALMIPSILIPYPYAKEHQLDNARFLSDRNAAVLIEDSPFCQNELKEKIVELKNNSDKLRQISQSLNSIKMPDARSKMAALAFRLAKEN